MLRKAITKSRGGTKGEPWAKGMYPRLGSEIKLAAVAINLRKTFVGHTGHLAGDGLCAKHKGDWALGVGRKLHPVLMYFGALAPQPIYRHRIEHLVGHNAASKMLG